MINELFQLSQAMARANISVQNWHRKYKPIPNISDSAPCLRVILSGGNVTQISTVGTDMGTHLRKYGSNQGTFPCCNLAPLYRVTDEIIKKKLTDLQQGNLEMLDLEEVHSWCNASNWGEKFQKKYAISMKAVPKEMHDLLQGSPDAMEILQLIRESRPFTEPKILHDALENVAFHMLDQKTEVSLALHLLFHTGKPEKSSQDDTGTLSVVFDCETLIDAGIPVVSVKFTRQLNEALLAVDGEAMMDASSESDAFGMPFTPLEEPMPTVKLAGGFEVTLRTMFGANRCQMRYGGIENASYPISPQMRQKLQGALGWLGNAEHHYKTWINTDKDEILFVYPHTLPGIHADFVRLFKRVPSNKTTFEKEAAALLSTLRGLQSDKAKIHADRLQVFILRKIDKARTKVLYTRITDPIELKARSDVWSRGCMNLPMLPFGQPETLFPMDMADVLNCVWKQDGTLVTNKLKPVPYYRGMELLMEPNRPVIQDMSILTKKLVSLAPYLGRLQIADRGHVQQIWQRVKDMLALCGVLLDRLHIRKERYMEDFPYEYGQLLKVSDELHILYCQVVRKGDVPLQLAGSSMVQVATEFPVRTIGQLGQRMLPYVTWAKSYRYHKPIAQKAAGKISTMSRPARAGWLLDLYEGIVEKLCSTWDPSVRFGDVQKAQLFLGYLAALPKKDKTTVEGVTEKEENGNG